MAKKKAGGKGKAPRVDKAPPTPSSANPQQQNSALPSPEKTPTAATKPHSLPGSPFHTPPTSPHTPVAGLPVIPATFDAEPETKEASVAHAEPGEGEHQLPTPREPDIPLPTVTEGDEASQQGLVVDADVNSAEPQPGDNVAANLDALPESKEPVAGDLLGSDQPTTTPEKEGETAADAGMENGPMVDDVKTVEELQTSSQPTEEFDKSLPPPPVDEVPGDEGTIEEKPQDPLLQTSEAAIGEDHTVGLADQGEQQGQETLLDWDDWAEESAGQQLDETLIDFNDSAGASVPEVPEDPEAQLDTGLGELSAEAAPISEGKQEHVEDLIDIVPTSQDDEAPLLDATAAAEEEGRVEVGDLIEGSKQTGEVTEQPLEDWNETSALESHEIPMEEHPGDLIEQATTDDHIVDLGENHESGIVEEGHPIEQAPTDGQIVDVTENHDLLQENPGDRIEQATIDDHIVDFSENHELYVTEEQGHPIDQALADDKIMDVGENLELGITEKEGHPFEQAPTDSQIVDVTENHDFLQEDPSDRIEQATIDDHIVDLSESHELDITEGEGDPMEQAPTNDHIVDFSENHELVEGDPGDPIERAPTDNHILDLSENHELDITEGEGDPIDQVAAVNEVVDTGETPERDITEAAEDPLEEAPADDDHVVVDTNQNLGLEINAHDVSDSRQEDISLAEVQVDQITDGETLEDIDPNVSSGDRGVDGIPGEAESGSAQQLHEGERPLADGDGPAVGEFHAEEASHAEETTAIDDPESMEHNSAPQTTDIVDLGVASVPSVAEEQLLNTLGEGTRPDDLVEPQPSSEGNEISPPLAQPGEGPDQELRPEADPNVEVASVSLPEQTELEADTAPDDLEGVTASLAGGTELPGETHDSLTALAATDPIPEAEQIPSSHPIALDIDLHNPSISIDPAPQSEDQQAELIAETEEMAVSENHIDIRMDEASEVPPAIQLNDTSVASPANGIAIMGQESSLSVLSAQDVATPEIIAISEMFGTMRTALLAMTSAFDRLGVQTERMAANSLHIKATEQLGSLKAALGHQIARQKSDVEALRLALQSKIKQAAEEKIRAHLRDVIKQAVKAQVEETVRAQMAVQIPDDLRQQVISHQRKIIQVKTALHNSEARMYNALQTVPGARLRPLLRPLPTPEQSPVVINISRSSSMGNTTLGTPRSAFPLVPAPTPIKRSVSNSMRPGGGLETVPPTPSKFFPRDLTALFALSQDEARRLLREYGLKSTAPSPAIENNTPMRARGLSIVSEEGTEEEDPEVHARDMNTFMAHIGVPFLMIPPPKEKPGAEMPPLSSRSRRKMLTPLIIK